MKNAWVLWLIVAIGCGGQAGVPEFSEKTFREDVADLIEHRRYQSAFALINAADPVALADFDRAGFLAVGEEMIVLPGVYPGVSYDRERDWFIPGTSDVIEDEQWQEAATKFAKEYNLHRGKGKSFNGN